MVQYHGRSKRTKTGKKLKKFRKKRKREMGRPPVETKLADYEARKVVRTMGGNFKLKLMYATHVNVVDKEGKIHHVEIKNVVHNPCSVDYSRRSIITKGAILETELGYVKITSRPGQHGILNGILIDYEKTK